MTETGGTATGQGHQRLLVTPRAQKETGKDLPPCPGSQPPNALFSDSDGISGGRHGLLLCCYCEAEASRGTHEGRPSRVRGAGAVSGSAGAGDVVPHPRPAHIGAGDAKPRPLPAHIVAGDPGPRPHWIQRCQAPPLATPTWESEVPGPTPRPAYIGAGVPGPAPALPTSNICEVRIAGQPRSSWRCPSVGVHVPQLEARGRRAGRSLGRVLDGAELGQPDLPVQLFSRALKMLSRPPGIHHPRPPHPSPAQEFHGPSPACNSARLTHAPTSVGSGTSPGLSPSSPAALTWLWLPSLTTWLCQATPGPGCGVRLCLLPRGSLVSLGALLGEVLTPALGCPPTPPTRRPTKTNSGKSDLHHLRSNSDSWEGAG